MAIEIVDLPIKNKVVFHVFLYVYQRVDRYWTNEFFRSKIRPFTSERDSKRIARSTNLHLFQTLVYYRVMMVNDG